MKEEISENAVKVRRKSGRAMAVVLTLNREVIRITCAYGPQSGRPDIEKVRFYNEMASEWDLGSSSKVIVSLVDFNEHVGKCAEGFADVHGKNCIAKRNAEERRLIRLIP